MVQLHSSDFPKFSQKNYALHHEDKQSKHQYCRATGGHNCKADAKLQRICTRSEIDLTLRTLAWFPKNSTIWNNVVSVWTFGTPSVFNQVRSDAWNSGDCKSRPNKTTVWAVFRGISHWDAHPLMDKREEARNRLSEKTLEEQESQAYLTCFG